MNTKSNPANHKELLKMRRVFIATYGERQLKDDYDNMMAKVKEKDETKKVS